MSDAQRSNAFARAEEEKKTLMELADCEKEQAIFLHLASQIQEDMTLYEAKPLTDEQLEIHGAMFLVEQVLNGLMSKI